MCKSCKADCAQPVAPGDYTVAYSLGYYYGRAFALEHDAPMLAEDLYHQGTVGFEAGKLAGKRDFEQVDLVEQALAAKLTD